ncbi:MAG: hypothetical protein NXI04_16220 [Planctomycetaceae bacterium]|nr:hypothetical protein [Planctomycetaceae bacterium]
MRQAIGLLLLVLPVTGCGKPTPAGAGGKPVNAVRVPDLQERHARNFLTMALEAKNDGDTQRAITGLEKVIADYPTSQAADRAQVVLKKLQDGSAKTDTEDGETPQNPDRDRAQEFLSQLSQIKSAEEEMKLLTEFADWLRDNKYTVRLEIVDDATRLTCPDFPPVTPWVSHTFLDSQNMALLPVMTEPAAESP